MGTKKIDVDKMAAAIEADAGEAVASEDLAGLGPAHVEAKAGVGRQSTPGPILVRQAREKSGLTQVAFAERIMTPVATLRHLVACCVSFG